MALDPQMKAILDQLEAMEMPGLSALPVDEARQAIMAFRDMSPPGEEVASTRDIAIPGPGGDIPARVYVGNGGTAAMPGVVFFHGGGWVLGNIESHDATCRALANRANAVVVSVDYRLAPEHRFPAAVEDCIAATVWVHDHATVLGIDPARLAVAGDSAGGNLAAVVCLHARDHGGPPIRYQLLIYPATDARMQAASIEENKEGYLLTKADMEWFYGHYAAPDPKDWRVSPLLAEDLAGLPPAMVLTAGYDPLRDEGDAYARRLADAGVDVRHERYEGLIHGFFGMGAHVAAAAEALDAAGQALHDALAR